MVEKEKMAEVDEISRKKHVSNLEREIKSYTKNVEEHKGLLVRLNKERETIKKRFEIMRRPENFKIVHPVWQYETDPEYVATLLMENENHEVQIGQQLNQNEDQIKKVIEAQETALISVKEEFDRIKGDN